MNVISTIETDLVDTLTAAVAGAKLRVDSLPGDWDDDMLARLLQLAPCVLVSFAGGTSNSPGELEPSIDGQWHVYAVTSHPSGQSARRTGNAQALGAYDLVGRLIVPALHGHLVPDVGTLELRGVENLFTGAVERKGLAVYSCKFAIPMAFEIDAAASGLADFATFAAQYDLPPFADMTAHANWLDGDYTTSAPDARDTVALPTTTP